MRTNFLIVAALALFCICSCGQTKLMLTAPYDGITITNNMPNLAWTPIECSEYEIWVDDIKMGNVPAWQNSYVVFPLSFGEHSWKVVAVTPKGRIESNIGNFKIDDKPLAYGAEKGHLLRDNWMVKSSVEVGLDGAAVSSPEIKVEEWAKTSLPATVLTALVRNGVYPNPYIAQNNMLIPDLNDEYNTQNNMIQHSHLKGQNPWLQPYWFRTEFTIPSTITGKQTWLNFGEINYKAQVWLNGVMIADTTEMIGMERFFKFNISSLLSSNSNNILAVAIYPPNNPGKPAPDPLTPLGDPGQNMGDGILSRDYTKWDAMGWDWQPPVRDRDMGITEDVYLSTTNDLEFDNLYVSSALNLPDTLNAEITVTADILNHSSLQMQGVARGTINHNDETISFEVPYSVAPNGATSISKVINIANAKLWWPHGYGEQNLYTLSLIADQSSIEDIFGIRQVETYIGAKERVYKINGRDIYLKGGNWVIDMMLNWNASRYEKEILLTRNANLNILRVWGPTGIAPKALFEAADKYGVLIWQDFLNDFWGTFKNTPGYQPEISLFEKATIDIVEKYRNHPSLIIWCGGNEGVNPREDLIVNSILAKFDNRDSRHYLKQSDGDGLHGGGPYHTLEPKKYFSHPKLMGFSSEIGPSGIPEWQSIIKFMPNIGKTWFPGRFPLDGDWAYHDANDWPGNDTRKFSSYDNIVRNFYGAPDTTKAICGAQEYIGKTQAVNYDVYRASIESINRQLWTNASGILLWKSNSSWPSATWQVYDWYLQSHAGYYGTKKASEAIHIQLNRDDRSVTLINLLGQSMENVTVKALLLDSNLNTIFEQTEQMQAPSNSAVLSEITIPESKQVEFLKLTAIGASGAILSDNFYWLNDNDDFKELAILPKPRISIAAQKLANDGNMQTYQVSVSNDGKTLAYLLSMKIVGAKSKQELLPSYWSDNYICLLPGERKTLTVKLFEEDIVEDPILQYYTYGHKRANYTNLHSSK